MRKFRIKWKKPQRKKERVTPGRVNVLSERERNNFCLPLKVTDTHRQREREKERERER